MTDIERAIFNALLDLDQAVRTMKTAHPKPNLLPIFSRIDDLTRQLPTSADPELLHFLHKKSYEKAILHLQGKDTEKGSCRR